MMKTNMMILGMIAVTMLSSCIKENDTPSKTKAIQSFSFATSREVQVNVQYALAHNTKIEVYSQNPVSIDGLGNYVKNETLTPLADIPTIKVF